MALKNKFVCYYYFISWWAWSLGIHVDLSCPNMEIHLPFGFIRIGWEGGIKPALTDEQAEAKIFGIH